jgi:rhodanese-related sulfurtransferase
VAERYRELGFENVKALEGGVEAWRRAGYDVEAPHRS